MFQRNDFSTASNLGRFSFESTILPIHPRPKSQSQSNHPITYPHVRTNKTSSKEESKTNLAATLRAGGRLRVQDLEVPKACHKVDLAYAMRAGKFRFAVSPCPDSGLSLFHSRAQRHNKRRGREENGKYNVVSAGTRGDKDLAFCSHYAPLLGMNWQKSRRRNGSVKGVWAAVVRADKRVASKPNVIVDGIWGCDRGQLDNITGGGSVSQSRTPPGRRSTARLDICGARGIKIPSLPPSSVPRHHSSQTPPREIHDSIIPPCPAPGVGDGVFDTGTEGEGDDNAGKGDP
ncbi:hypothetical protein FIBSPDRAFT_899445 [Athelia psychrophila]|uniref:Uncharacterized protein n=1 Tax=Athelia psychrophila TaxID=1759441 RepID=A0A165ZPU1_9AGAM|nr:hypothetical protein FIBSPDRAFT_899445 [Fibularhizoctonia sp. CBS 109695]